MFKRQRKRSSSTRLKIGAPFCRFKHARYDIKQMAFTTVMQSLFLYRRPSNSFFAGRGHAPFC